MNKWWSNYGNGIMAGGAILLLLVIVLIVESLALANRPDPDPRDPGLTLTVAGSTPLKEAIINRTDDIVITDADALTGEHVAILLDLLPCAAVEEGIEKWRKALP